MVNSYPPVCDLHIGDLVYLEKEEKIGIIIKLSFETKFEPPATNAYVLWSGNQESWCLGESLVVLSKSKSNF